MSLEFELVLPCYNESKSLEALIHRTIEAAQSAGYTSQQFKLVLVENGSSDDSLNILQLLQKTYLGVWFRVVKIDSNRGYGFGLASGLQTTVARYVGWSHADQQCDPNDAFVALSLIKCTGNERILVKGIRNGRNWKDKSVSRIFEIFAWLILGARIHEINAQPKVFPRSLWNEVKNPPTTFAFDLYILYCAKKAKFHIQNIPVLFPPRIHGMSNWASNFFSRYKTVIRIIQYMWQLAHLEGRL